jgi:hypothetical protein
MLPSSPITRHSGAPTGWLVAESDIDAAGRPPIPVPAEQGGMPAAATIGTYSHGHVAVAEHPSTVASTRPTRPQSLRGWSRLRDRHLRVALLTQPFGTVAAVVLPDVLSLGPTLITAGWHTARYAGHWLQACSPTERLSASPQCGAVVDGQRSRSLGWHTSPSASRSPKESVCPSVRTEGDPAAVHLFFG